MAKLSQAIAADTSPVYLDSPLTTAYPGRFTLGSEAVYVHGGSGTAYVSITRGADGTTAVPHAAGTTLVSAPLGSVSGSGTPGPWQDPTTMTPEQHAQWHIDNNTMEPEP